MNDAFLKTFFGTGLMVITTFVHAAEPGLYFNVGAGPSFVQDVDLKRAGGAKSEFDVGIRTDVAVGYQFNPNWAGELETGLTWNAIRKTGAVVPPPAGGAYAAYQRGKGDLYQTPLLANVVYTLPLDSRFVPYVGAGAGLMAAGLDARFPGGDVEDTDIDFAFQVFTGFRVAINDRMDVGAAYKFMGTPGHHWSDNRLDVRTKEIFTHAIMLIFSLRL